MMLGVVDFFIRCKSSDKTGVEDLTATPIFRFEILEFIPNAEHSSQMLKHSK